MGYRCSASPKSCQHIERKKKHLGLRVKHVNLYAHRLRNSRGQYIAASKKKQQKIAKKKISKKIRSVASPKAGKAHTKEGTKARGSPPAESSNATSPAPGVTSGGSASVFASDFALKHVSIRVPWHDSLWNGTICENPGANVACLALKRTGEDRDDASETLLAAQNLQNLQQAQWPVCVEERGMFMAPFPLTREVTHPYAGFSSLHKLLLPTTFRHPPYSAAVLPFRRVLWEEATKLAQELQLDFSEEREPEELSKFAWVQDYHNQKAILDSFFDQLKPLRSLCFFYAKQTSLAEKKPLPVIVGVGFVKAVDGATEYDRKGTFRSLIWERSIQHTIREDSANGFLLPYKLIEEKAKENPKLDPEDYLVYAPEDRSNEFKYASELVTNDAAISTLLSINSTLDKMSQVLSGYPFSTVKSWIDARLSELWRLRGAYPGLGAALLAFGVDYGNLAAYEICSKLNEEEDPWEQVDKVIDNPAMLSRHLAEHIGPSTQLKWKKIKPNRKALLKLLSRFELTQEQAKRFFLQEERKNAGIDCTDDEIIANPYLISELDRSSADPVSFFTIDKGAFPPKPVLEHHPLPEPSRLGESTDPRRVRGLLVDLLDKTAAEGHTLLTRAKVIEEFRNTPIQPACMLDGDLLDAIEDLLKPIVEPIELAERKGRDDRRAYQLKSYVDMGRMIRNFVIGQLKASRHSISENWKKFLDDQLAGLKVSDPMDKREEDARREKAAALQELAESRFSVLIGPAGTGKTTLLASLCNHKDVKEGGILLVAPTGKARVKMQQTTGLPAYTIAQFLIQYDRYDDRTGVYHLSDSEKKASYRTVIVDEASMLTEDALAALIDCLEGVRRFVLVGDPRQLPPIGAGRPFVDIVTHLAPPNLVSLFPRVSSGYRELTIHRRQIDLTSSTDDVLLDTQLSEWFSGMDLGAGDDEIFETIAKKSDSQRIKFVNCLTEDDLVAKVLKTITEELHLASTSDEQGFEMSVGGEKHNDNIYFNRDAIGAVEKWQILTPLRGQISGTTKLNRLIQRTFRSDMKKFAETSGRVPRPAGPEGILYGDKIINVQNKRRFGVYPKVNALEYVANGEIGLVIGKFSNRGEYSRHHPMWVAFSSQPGFSYTYTEKDFGDDSNPLLELAYAITVHKSQGSEFGTTIVVLPNPCRLLSRELLYTALTRHRDRLIILYQGALPELQKYSSDYFSETARRLTNLFKPADPVEIEDGFFEDGLIHRTATGVPVRSKSEVIIADALTSHKIKYKYEEKFVGDDGFQKRPDFTFEDPVKGKIIWEHLGMLSDPGYVKRWERKLGWYKKQGVVPIEEGIGMNGTLVTSKDTEAGGINSDEINATIDRLFS